MMAEVVAARHRHRGADRRASRSPGKTGTAQVDGRARRTRGSSRSRRPRPRGTRSRCIVEHGGSFGSEATGGRVAAPIAAQVLRVALGHDACDRMIAMPTMPVPARSEARGTVIAR